uniref:Uncharacterized protein n=1 Tax=Candidatus Enterococcus clewellii TaxID=1834193 RepID=A0A242K6U2_9ENTE|nr:hypothetical protein A5888_002233 [Enterococcus sp. 9E7_DIV0242]
MDTTIKNSINRILSLDFFVETDRKKYGDQPLIKIEKDTYYLAEDFSKCLDKNPWFHKNVMDVINTSFERSNRYDLTRPLTYNEVYTRQDVCRLLNWENDEKGTMYGYRIKYDTFPIFVNYHKDDSIDNSVKYEDELIDRHTLLWYTKANRNMNSAVIHI